jgi:mono/diheme cytochrome c family protein
MEETVFFILGIGLVVAALVLSAIGLRWESFPPSGALMGLLVGAFAAVVVATGAFAWMQAADHQREHAPELAEERAERTAELAAQQREEIAAEEGAAPQEEAADVDAVQVFDSAGCGGCHTLEAAGTTATVGPDLDQALRGRSPQFIEESIVDPNAEIAQGFSPNVMPGTYQEQLSAEEIEALVDMLHQDGS